MAYNSLTNNSGTFGSFTGRQGSISMAVRVKDIILDDKHPEYKKYGKTSAIGVIKYESVVDSVNEPDTENLSEAYPLDVYSKTYPLVNEIVILHKAPATGEPDRKTNVKAYYSTIINAWNLLNHNASAPWNKEWEENQYEIGEGIQEIQVNPLKPSPGDILFSGRHGQSIRFSGYNHNNNPLFNQDNDGKPITIIRNGQQEEKDREKFINEDINKDDSSIYLTSNHPIKLKPARDKQDSFKERPKSPETYIGKQVAIASGRLVFDAKDDDMLFASKGSLGISSLNVGIDGKEYVSLDADKIYLGKFAKDYELQPVILGNSLEVFLTSLLTALDSLATKLTAASASGVPILALNQEGPALKAVAQALKKQINPNGKSQLKSRKVFTE